MLTREFGLADPANRMALSLAGIVREPPVVRGHSTAQGHELGRHCPERGPVLLRG